MFNSICTLREKGLGKVIVFYTHFDKVELKA